jgi:subtilisin family serine protease
MPKSRGTRGASNRKRSTTTAPEAGQGRRRASERATLDSDTLAKLDPRLAASVLRPRPAGSRVPSAAGGGPISPAAAGFKTKALSSGSIVVPASVSRLPLGLNVLLTQVSFFNARRLDESDGVSVLVERQRGAETADVESSARSAGFEVKSVSSSTLVARGPRRGLVELAGQASVRYVEASLRLEPHCDLAHVSANLTVALDGRRRVPQTGKGVLVGLVDTGIDVGHPAFQGADGKTRVVDYLDQTTRPPTHYTDAQLRGGRGGRSPDEIGHGTHVAGIAAGNGGGSSGNRYAGVAPEADLAVVKTTFGTASIAEGVAHLFTVAEQRGQPCVVNLSLGGHSGGHDGSSILERTIDTLCERSGRVVVASAGNEGDAAIHASTVLPRGAATAARWVADIELEKQVVNNTLMGLLWVEVWTQHEDDLSVTLRSPNGELFRAPRGGHVQTDRGKFAVDASHQVARYSDDNVTSFGIFTVPQPEWMGGWSLIVEEDRDGGRHGVEVGAVHAWITSEEMGRFVRGAVRSHLVGMPGTAFSALTVASYATRREWKSADPQHPDVVLDAVNLEDVSYFSSPGPTREAQNKPDIAAPGQWLISALSGKATADAMPLWLRLPDAPYAALQGTSMAAPYVTGAIALLLEKHPEMHWVEVRRRLVKSGKQDRFTTPCWNERWGFGKLDVEKLLTIEP